MALSLRTPVASVVAFAAYFLVAWLVPGRLGLAGADAWMLRGLLVALGLVGAGITAWYLRARRRAAGPAIVRVADDPMDQLLAVAEQRLQAAGAGRHALGRLPVLLLVGPAGSTKTTVLREAELDADLLAGDGGDGALPTATTTLNLWYARGTVIVEAGAQLLERPERWQHLVERFAAPRLGAALRSVPAPPRSALVCLSCDTLLAGPAAVDATLRPLRARLLELAARMRAPLPLYVLVTKADRLPHFDAYARHLSDGEIAQPLGAGLRLDEVASADRLRGALRQALDRVVDALALHRVDVLERAYPEGTGAAYEFPRELRKAVPVLEGALTELARPSQLAAGPVLRGVWLAGVRATLVPVAPAAAAQARRARPAVAFGATGVFEPHRAAGLADDGATHDGPMGLDPEPGPAATRRVAQWVFLRRFLTEVPLADASAQALGRGRPADGIRRALLAAAALAALLVGAAVLRSYLGNRALAAGALTAAARLPDTLLTGAWLPTSAALGRLEAARARLDTLERWERDAPPWRLRWGLYAGPRVLPELRRAWLASFDRLMLRAARTTILDTLRALPPSPRPGDVYGAAYADLKAYLVTTDYPDSSRAAFLAPVLLERWRAGRVLGAERTELARRQFAAYAGLLPRTHALAVPPDSAAVRRARGYLRAFAESDRVYSTLLAQAGRDQAPVAFARLVPEAAGFVADGYVVPGAFTQAGWVAAQEALRHPERLLAAESWVLGESSAGDLDLPRLAGTLRDRYAADYRTHWTNYLAAASVARYADVPDAARRLRALSDLRSPLFAVLALASRHTDVATPAIAQAFRAVQVVAPPDSVHVEGARRSYVGSWNMSYVKALADLQSALQFSPVGDAAGGTQGRLLQAISDARGAARQFAVGAADGDPAVNAEVQRLLEAPIEGLDPVLRAAGREELSAGGRTLCAPVRQLAGKFPFDPRARVDATPDEIAALLHPGTGSLWSFVREPAGQRMLVQEGLGYRARPSSGATASEGFVRFVNRAAAVSRALYQRGSFAPELTFTLRPRRLDGVDEVTVVLGDRSITFGPGDGAQTFTWSPVPGAAAELVATLAGGSEVRIAGRYEGPWAAFRLFQSAYRWEPGSGGRSVVEWRMRAGAGDQATTTTSDGSSVGVAFDLGEAQPALRSGALGGLRCPEQIAR